MKKRRHIHLWILIFIVLLSGGLRLWHLGYNPFVADEFLDVNATYGYHETGRWHAWDFNRNAPSLRQNNASDQRAWLYRIQVASLYNRASFLPPTETTARLVSVFWGVMMTIIIYVVTLSWTRNRWMALTAAGLWALSVPAIEINRKVRMYSMFAPIFLLFSWSVFQFLEVGYKKNTSVFAQLFHFRYRYALPMVIFGMLAFHLHPLAGNMILILFVYTLIRAYQEYRRGQPIINRYALYMLLIIISGFLCAYFFPQQFAWVRATITFFENHWSYIGHVLATYQHPLIGALLLAYGSYIALHKKTTTPAQTWIVVNFFTILLAGIFLWARNVGPQYIFFAQAFGMILVASGLVHLVMYLKKNLPKRAVVIVIVLLIALLPQYGYFFQKNNTYHISSSGESVNYRKVFDYVKRHATNNDVMITRNFRNYYYGGMGIPVFDFGSDRSADALQREGKVKKITLPYVKEIIAQHPSGWVVFSDNDEKFITKEARQYFADTMTRINDSSLVRGKVAVYRWSFEYRNIDK